MNQWLSGQNVKIWINCNKTWTLCCKSISLQSHWYTMQGSFFLSGLHIAWFLKWPFHAPLSIEPLPTLKGTKDYYKKIKYCYLKLRKFHHLLYNFLCGTTHLLCVLYHSLYSLDVMVVLSSLLFGSHVKVKRKKADGKQKDYELANYIHLHEIIDFVYFMLLLHPLTFPILRV